MNRRHGSIQTWAAFGDNKQSSYRSGPAHVKSLGVIDVHRSQSFQRLRVLHPLRDGLEPHHMPQAMNCFDYCFGDAVIRNFLNESSIYLEVVDRQGLEVAERGQT